MDAEFHHLLSEKIPELFQICNGEKVFLIDLKVLGNSKNLDNVLRSIFTD